MSDRLASLLQTARQGLVLGLRNLFSTALALVILFEEWGWLPLQALLARLARWPPLRSAEALIRRLPPWPALALFALPTLALLPVKLAALALIAHGRPLAGLAVILVAKLLGTAVVARLYLLTQPALLQLAWFARLHHWWLPWKADLLARVRRSWAWRRGRALRRALRRRWAQW